MIFGLAVHPGKHNILTLYRSLGTNGPNPRKRNLASTSAISLLEAVDELFDRVDLHLLPLAGQRVTCVICNATGAMPFDIEITINRPLRTSGGLIALCICDLQIT